MSSIRRVKSTRLNNLTRLRQHIRHYVDSITTYRVVLYGLSFLVVAALTLSAFDVLRYSTLTTLLLVLGLLSVVCFSVNLLLSRVFKVNPNFESSIITTLILFFVLAVPSSPIEWLGVALGGTVAMASKYLITWRSSHIFNPAAFAVLAVSAIGVGNGAWWIADATLFLPVLLVGLLVLYKLRRFELFFAFAVPAIVLILLRTMSDMSLGTAFVNVATLYPILFLGSIMLTEPHTMPVKRYDRLTFGAIVGIMFASTFDFGFISSSPHLALLIGNVYALLVTTRAAATLTLVEKKRLTPTTYGFRFKPAKPIKRVAGQYMEFTLPGVKQNTRGNRRTFTIASPPHDEYIDIGVKFYSPGSNFKTKLRSLRIGDEVSASNVAGEFTLPVNPSIPIVFLAGGIGITPFIAMIKEMVVSDMPHTIDLYYFVSDASEIAYSDVLTQAKSSGIHVHIRMGREQRLTDADINTHCEAEFYLSGPPGFVDAYRMQLKAAGIKKMHVDYFTGY